MAVVAGRAGDIPGRWCVAQRHAGRAEVPATARQQPAPEQGTTELTHHNLATTLRAEFRPERPGEQGTQHHGRVEKEPNQRAHRACYGRARVPGLQPAPTRHASHTQQRVGCTEGTTQGRSLWESATRRGSVDVLCCCGRLHQPTFLQIIKPTWGKSILIDAGPSFPTTQNQTPAWHLSQAAGVPHAPGRRQRASSAAQCRCKSTVPPRVTAPPSGHTRQ